MNIFRRALFGLGHKCHIRFPMVLTYWENGLDITITLNTASNFLRYFLGGLNFEISQNLLDNIYGPNTPIEL